MADMFYNDGAQIPMSRFIQPRLECELGFVIGRRLKGPNCTIFDVLSATDYVVAGGARSSTAAPTASIRKPTAPRCVLDSIADNAGNAALVVGGRPIRPMEVDLRWVAVLCYRNDIIEESGVAAAVLNHPANGVAWLANKLAPFDIALEPGQFVLGGSFTSTVEAHAGDQFHVDYGPLGRSRAVRVILSLREPQRHVPSIARVHSDAAMPVERGASTAVDPRPVCVAALLAMTG